ncbi:MFS transporter [Sphingobium sp. LSP13-1-1.1]|uniref:MFS transporter n=1 Tax=Sphingobium sp. LSP13-1-1.1 TaxID=3135234 RepID=UPI0034353E11
MTTHQRAGFATGISLLLPITLSAMAIVLLAPNLPALLQEFASVEHHEYWVPMVLTVPALCVALFSPMAGILGDRFGRRRLLLAAFLVYAVVGIAPVFLSDLGWIIVSRVAVGMAEAMIMVLSTTMIGDYFEGPARDRWLAGQTAMASISALLFLNVGGFLGRFGWRAPFWVYGSALLMFVLVLLFTWEPARRDSPDAEIAQRDASSAGFPWLRMSGIIAITVFGSVLFYTAQIQSPIGLTQFGITDPARIGFLTSLASIGVPVGTYVYSRVGSKLPIASLLLIEFTLLAIGFLLMSRSGAPAGFLAGCFINQLGAGMLLPSLLVWAISGLPFEVRSRGAGLWTGAFSVGQFLCPVVVTVAGSHTGGLRGAFGVLAAAALVGAALSLFARLRKDSAMVHA